MSLADITVIALIILAATVWAFSGRRQKPLNNEEREAALARQEEEIRNEILNGPLV